MMYDFKLKEALTKCDCPMCNPEKEDDFEDEEKNE